MSAQTPIDTPHGNLNAVLAKVGELAHRAAGGSYIYRGEPKPYPRVSSGLYRLYEDIQASDFDIEFVQREILGQARGYTRYTGETDDLEILSQIQHNGGETNLIDFTTDFLIALFFACDGEPGESGRIILLAERGEGYQVLEPSNPVHRVVAQKSVFVRPAQGFIEPDAVVSISSQLKSSILDYLREYHDIRTETIYNDLHGFIRHRGIHRSAYIEFYKGESESNQENYRQAIVHYNDALELNPQLVPAYTNRGVAYQNIGDYENAIRDYQATLELNPAHPGAYNNLGVVNFIRGDYENAIHNYNLALNLRLSHMTYNNRGEAWLHLGEWDSARADLIAARNMGGDIVASFRNDYASVADFEQCTGLTVPGDITELLGG